MNKIDERIEWYEQNATNWYDNLVRIELNKIKELHAAYQDSLDEMFVDEMLEAFCKAIESQRERIAELEAELNGEDTVSAPAFALPQGEFQNDKQLQKAFTQYCLINGKSSYTVNDYCSRIKNLWKSFFADYSAGLLPKELRINNERVDQGNPLLNAFYHTEELDCYISIKIAESDGNRNWANGRAAFNKLIKFKISVNNIN